MAKKYSASERKAFHMGVAYAAAKAGKRVACPDEKTKKSFKNGVKSVREGKQSGGKKSAQVKNGGNKNSGQAQSVVAFVPGVGTCRINNDGCILEVL